MDFLEMVDNQIRIALRSNCKQIAQDQLIGKQPIKIRYAFYSSPVNGVSKLIHILVLPPALKLHSPFKRRIIRLQDYILSEGWQLVVINQDVEERFHGDTSMFISENLAVNSADMLWINCIQTRNDMAMVIFELYEPIRTILRDLWNGTLHYRGPVTGFQMVNLEIMKDQCQKCGKAMKTVSGVVFPDLILRHLDNTSWKYFNQILLLSKWNGRNAQMIAKFIANLRVEDGSITPVIIHFRRGRQSGIPVACCPYCNAGRREQYLDDDRSRYLFSIQSRLNGELEYYAIELNVDQETLSYLYQGFEANDHTTETGWSR